MNYEAKMRCEVVAYGLQALANHDIIDIERDDVFIVHGLVSFEDEDFFSAWIRVGEDIYVPTTEHVDGNQVITKHDAQAFRDCSGIKSSREYSIEDVVKEVEHHKTFGPWCPSILATLAAANDSPLPANVIPLNKATLH